MEADICLETLRKAFQYSIHVDAVGVGPGVLEVLLQPLPERVRNLMEADKLPDSQHLGVVTCRA